MLLHIDVYPSKFQVTDLQGPLPPSPTPPLFACLASTSSSSKPGDDPAKGLLLTAGRSDQSDVCLLKDKSVSRDHLILRLISKHASHHHELVLKDNDDNNASIVVAKAAMAPRNDEEQAACDNSDTGMCIVLENLGKFGSLVVVPKPPSNDEDDNNKKEKDNDDEDDETGDEEEEPDNAISKSESQVAKAVLQPRQHDIQWKRLGPNESAVLYDLSGGGTTNNNNTSSTAVQVGQNGATLVITKIQWNMAWSGVQQNVIQLWKDRLYAFGATSMQEDEDATKDSDNTRSRKMMTHLITLDGVASAKLLTAWCTRVPIVSIDFLQAMLQQRQSPKDPLPNEQDFIPTGLTQRTWWQQHHHPNPNLWSNCTILSGTASNPGLESLARAAGAKVISLYHNNMTVAEALKTTSKIVEQQGAQGGGHSCFGMNPGTPKSKLVQLWKRLQIPILTAKDIANKITEQIPLVTTTNNSMAAADEDKVQPATKHEEKSTPITTSRRTKKANEPDTKTTTTSQARTMPRRGATKKEESKNDERDDEDEDDDNAKNVPPSESTTQPRAGRSASSATKKAPSTPDKTSVASKVKTKETSLSSTAAKANDESSSHHDHPMDSLAASATTIEKSHSANDETEGLVATTRTTGASKDKPTSNSSDNNSTRKRQTVDEVDAVQQVPAKKAKTTEKQDGRMAVLESITEETKSKPKRRGQDESDNVGALQQDDKEEDGPYKMDRHSAKPKRVETPRDGWYIAAPQGTQERQAFRRSFEESNEGDEGSPVATAVTDVRKDLVVIRHLRSSNKSQPSTTTTTPTPTTTNFKRFRKNIVMRRGDHSLVQLQSVLPKETPLLRDLEEQQLMLEEVQRTADALFHDGTAKGTKTKSSGNSILSYMTKEKKKKAPASATKRGRRKAITVDDDDDEDELDI